MYNYDPVLLCFAVIWNICKQFEQFLLTSSSGSGGKVMDYWARGLRDLRFDWFESNHGKRIFILYIVFFGGGWFLLSDLAIYDQIWSDLVRYGQNPYMTILSDQIWTFFPRVFCLASRGMKNEILSASEGVNKCHKTFYTLHSLDPWSFS